MAGPESELARAPVSQRGMLGSEMLGDGSSNSQEEGISLLVHSICVNTPKVWQATEVPVGRLIGGIHGRAVYIHIHISTYLPTVHTIDFYRW